MAKAKGSGKGGGTSAPAESPIERTARAAAVDAEAELASLLAEIREHERAISARFYDLGLALKRIADRKLYGVRNHASLAALLRAEKLMSARQATKLIKVVTQVRREHALSLGLEKTYALLGYAETTPAADSVASLVEGGADVANSSLRKIESETRAVRASKPARPATAAQKDAAAMASAVKSGVRAAGLGGAVVTVGRKDVRIVVPKATVARWMAKRSG